MKSIPLLATILVSMALSLGFVGLTSPSHPVGPRSLADRVPPQRGRGSGCDYARVRSRGLWRQFRYWVFENNIVPGLRNHPAWWIFIFPLVFPAVVYAGWRIIRATPDPVRAFRRGFVSIVCGFYLPALLSFWSLVTRQDYLPDHPSPSSCLRVQDFRSPEDSLDQNCSREGFFAAFRSLSSSSRENLSPRSSSIRSGSMDRVRRSISSVDSGGERSGHFVVDEKGETVFRQRNFVPIWEPCVTTRIRRGQLADNAAERRIQILICAAVLGIYISPAAGRFIYQNYLYVRISSPHRRRLVAAFER